MGRVGNAAGLESTSLFEGSSSEYDMDSSCPPKVPTCVSGQACSDNTVHRGGCWRPARPGDLAKGIVPEGSRNGHRRSSSSLQAGSS
jgi:hypothetical protein